MKLNHPLVFLFLGITLTACGTHSNNTGTELKAVNQPPLVKITKDSDSLETIGRGARLTLTKDIEIPANVYMAILETHKTYIMGAVGSSDYTELSIQCGITAKEKSLDRRMMLAGTVIELSGQWWRDPNGDNTSPWLRENLGVAKPGEIASVSCLAFARTCTSQTGLCGGYHQPKMTILDLKNGLRSAGIIEQAEPVIIK